MRSPFTHLPRAAAPLARYRLQPKKDDLRVTQQARLVQRGPEEDVFKDPVDPAGDIDPTPLISGEGLPVGVAAMHCEAYGYSISRTKWRRHFWGIKDRNPNAPPRRAMVPTQPVSLSDPPFMSGSVPSSTGGKVEVYRALREIYLNAMGTRKNGDTR